MNLDEFRALLDASGAESSAWPHDASGEAERLLAAEPAARALLAEAREVDALIVRALRGRPGAEDAAASRVLAALGRELPRQRRFALAWPAALTGVDLAPSRPRLAALAAVAALGVLLGLFGPDISAGDGGFVVAAASSEPDLGAVFEPEPLTGVRP